MGQLGQLASKKWVRMEDTGRVDDEGRAVLEKVDLMEGFFRSIIVRFKRICLGFPFSEVSMGGRHPDKLPGLDGGLRVCQN